MPSPPTPPAEAARSYAAALASPVTSRSNSLTERQAPAPTTTTSTMKGYPPIIIESLPGWVSIFEQLKSKLGHPLNVKPVGKGFRFTCKSTEEVRAVQRALTEASAADKKVAWRCYAGAADLPTKIAIKGLPYGIDPAVIVAELEAKGFPTKYVKEILPRKGSKGGPTYYVLLDRINNDEKSRLYDISELLNIPNVMVEGWVPRAGTVPQCHRCQAFGHASGGCHHPPRCVKCAGEHFAAECNRDPDQPPKCANCRGKHVACSRTCPHYLREARRRGLKVQGPYPRVAPQGPQGACNKITNNNNRNRQWQRLVRSMNRPALRARHLSHQHPLFRQPISQPVETNRCRRRRSASAGETALKN